TGSPAPFAGTPRLTPKFRSRFQPQRRPPDRRGTLAKTPGQRLAPSIRRFRDNAARSLVGAGPCPRRPPPSSRRPPPSERLRNNDGLSRAFLLRTMRADRAFRGRVWGVRVDDVSGAVAIVVTNPRHRKGQAVFVAALRREVEVVVRAQQYVTPARITGIGV